MEPTFTKTNRSITMMRCLGSGCNVFSVTGGNLLYGICKVVSAGDRRVGRAGRIDRNSENDTDAPEQGNPSAWAIIGRPSGAGVLWLSTDSQNGNSRRLIHFRALLCSFRPDNLDYHLAP